MHCVVRPSVYWKIADRHARTPLHLLIGRERRCRILPVVPMEGSKSAASRAAHSTVSTVVYRRAKSTPATKRTRRSGRTSANSTTHWPCSSRARPVHAPAPSVPTLRARIGLLSYARVSSPSGVPRLLASEADYRPGTLLCALHMVTPCHGRCLVGAVGELQQRERLRWRLEPLDELGTVVAHVVHERRHRVGVERPVVRRLEQRPQRARGPSWTTASASSRPAAPRPASGCGWTP